MRTSTYLLLSILLFTTCGTPRPKSPDPTVYNTQGYTGEYTRTDGTPIYIAQAGSGLAVIVTGNVFTLDPTGRDTFDLVGVAERIHFLRDADGTVKRIARERDLTISAHKARLTLADLLDMRHGLQCDDWVTDSPGNESQIYGQDDWTAFILAIPDNEKKGTDGAPTYCSAMPLMVGRYLELVTGKPLPEYADEVLFRPLSIARDDWTWNFGLSANKQQMGAQVHLRPWDMLRIAWLYASDGAVDGRQLLPPGWVGETFRAETPLGDWRRYHNFWWAYDVERPGKDPVTVNMASGIGGQKIALVPDLELAIVMTGGSFSQGRPGPTRIIERVLRSL